MNFRTPGLAVARISLRSGDARAKVNGAGRRAGARDPRPVSDGSVPAAVLPGHVPGGPLFFVVGVEEVPVLALVTAHLLVAGALPALARRRPRAAFLIAAVVPAIALGWALAEAPDVLAGAQPVEVVPWARVVGLELTFRLDPLALQMALLVSGVGALVLAYSRSYFDADDSAGQRSAPLLLAFAGSMLGLVLADDLITLYVFWELTTVCSFLLVGQAGVSRESRRAALQALMITAFGGLVMLLGFVLLGTAAGTYRISALLAHPPTGPTVTAAAVLVLVGALTKSAQIPFHNWLPAAMVAPTPVSAYLHAASMVKAGVFLVARAAPVFHELAAWWAPSVVLGLVTMLVAGWRAIHEVDLKKLLAYGSVSQLGFALVLLGDGTGESALAGAVVLLGHGLFKAALFLVVGAVDHQAGTRDLRQLSGLWRRMPVLAATAAVAAASMAGIPLLLGYLGKEAAFGAFVEDPPVEAGLVIGSVLTTAYSARLLWGAFATKPGREDTRADAPDWWLVGPAALCAFASLALGSYYPATDRLASGYAAALGASPHLSLWHGPLPAGLSLIALLGGLALHAAREPVSALRARLPRPITAQRGYERIMAGLERTAVGVTGRLQAGSLPTYVAIILLTVLAVPGTALLAGTSPPDRLPPYGSALQLLLGLLVVVTALAVPAARRRLTAVIMVGAVGYGVGGLFIVDGAPDLALAQFLVETLTLVAFVLVLRRLPVQFSAHGEAQRALRAPKAVVACLGGLLIAFAGTVVSAARHAPAVASGDYIARAQSGAGAANVVNAIVIDFRAFDTVGEISVLAVAATGVASLILRSRFERRRRMSDRTRKEQRR